MAPLEADLSLLHPELDGHHPTDNDRCITADGSPAVLRADEPGSFAADHPALALHRKFLQEVLAEVLPLLAAGSPGDERLIEALQAYWEACFARRDTRRLVSSLVADTQLEATVEPMGRPFFHMIVSELTPAHGALANSLAAMVYNEARAIAVFEAANGARMPASREKVIASIRAGHPAMPATGALP